MIFVVELPEQSEPRAWFAFDKEDFAHKVRSQTHPDTERLVYWNETEAVAAFEGGDPVIAEKTMWRARHALHQQLLALEVLADDC